MPVPCEFKIITSTDENGLRENLEEIFAHLSLEGWKLLSIDCGVSYWSRPLITEGESTVERTCGNDCGAWANNYCDKYRFSCGPQSPVCGHQIPKGKGKKR